MSLEEYSARGLGKLFEAARVASTAGCWVIDYADLGAELLFDIGSFFGIHWDISANSGLQETLELYSKDPTRTRRFSSDQSAKQSLAGDDVRRAVDTWARPAYEALRGQQR